MTADSKSPDAAANDQNDSHRPRGMGLYIIGFLLIVVAAFALWRLRHNQTVTVGDQSREQTASVEAGPRIRVYTVASAPASREVRLLGETYPWQTATLYAKVSGYLKEIHVDKGDHVSNDEVLAVIESPETDHDYDAAVSNAKNLRLNANRASALVKRDMVSQQDADTAEANAQVAEQNVASLATLKSYEVLRSPYAGLVTARFADPGALIQSAETAQTSALPVVTVSELDVLRTYVYPDQSAAAFIRVGDSADISAPERPDVHVSARVSRMSGQLDPKTRTMLTEIDFHNHGDQILPGSFVNVTMKINTGRATVLTVPADTLVLRNNQTYLAVVNTDNHVNFRPVKIGSDDGIFVQILSGVNPGERVARDLGLSVADGAAVQPIQTN